MATTEKRATAPAAAVRRGAGIGRRVVWAGLLLMFMAVFTSEAVGWLAVERFRSGVASLDLRDVPAARARYDRLRGVTPLRLASRVRVDDDLARRLVVLADGVLEDFRQEEPTVAEAQWRQAAAALEWASGLQGNADTLKARQLVCAGHLDRIAAQGKSRTSAADARKLYARAIDEFTQAAALDAHSADPYLGLSRVYIYGLADVDRGAQAIAEAEARGHKPGWRDQAQLGDGYLRRADDMRQKALALEDAARAAALKDARDDYLRCSAAFEPIVDKGRSRRNRDYCEHRADALAATVHGEGEGR